MIQVLDHYLKVHLVFHTMAEETYLTDRQKAQRKWYAANRDRQIAYQLEYHNANREERLKYQREYNKKYYQANRERNHKAEMIEKMMSVTETVNASASSSNPPKTPKAPKVEKAVAAVPSQWEIPPDAKPWTFVEPQFPKRQVHRPLKKKPTFQFVKGQFELSFD